MTRLSFKTWVSGHGAAVVDGLFAVGPSPDVMEVVTASLDKDVVRGIREDGTHQDFQLHDGRLVEAHVTPEGLVAMLEAPQPNHARRAFIERDGFVDWAWLETLKDEGARCRFYGWGARYGLPDTLAWQDLDELIADQPEVSAPEEELSP